MLQKEESGKGGRGSGRRNEEMGEKEAQKRDELKKERDKKREWFYNSTCYTKYNFDIYLLEISKLSLSFKNGNTMLLWIKYCKSKHSSRINQVILFV